MRIPTTLRCSLGSVLAISAAIACSEARAQAASAPSEALQTAETQTLARDALDAARRASEEATRAQAIAAQAVADSERLARSISMSADRADRAADTAERVTRGAILSPSLGEACTAGEDSWRRLRNGGSGDRRCVLTFLRAQRQQTLMLTADSRVGDWSELLQGASILSDYYLARSNRQQAVMDASTSTTAVGALGAGLSGPAGPHTVTMWGYGALLGVVLVNFTGSQPSRDLHFAGHLGVEYIVNRYVVMNNRLQVLNSLESAVTMDADRACGRVGAEPARKSVPELLTEVEGWTGEDKAPFLSVLQQMNDVCSRLRSSDVQFARIDRLTDQLRLEWPAAFASDLLSLDNRVTERDARLRLTPSSAVSAAAVAPLRVLDSLISGENTQDAVNRVRINALLDDMSVNLRPIVVPSPPATIDSPPPALSEIRARARLTQNPDGAATSHPTRDRVRAMAAEIADYAQSIETARTEHNDRAFFAAELHAAAARSVLNFDYAVETGVASISLEEPKPAAASPGPSTAAKTEGGPQVMPLPAG